MTRIMYLGVKPYKMIIKNKTTYLKNGDEVDVDLRKIKAKKMRRFKHVYEVNKEQLESDIREDFINNIEIDIEVRQDYVDNKEIDADIREDWKDEKLEPVII